jgi:CheY-like chemotaxis protein
MTFDGRGSGILRAEAALSDRKLVCYAVELSETSVFLVTDALAPVGERLSLRLSLSRQTSPLEISGVVSEVRLSSGPGAPSGFAVRFDTPSEADMPALRRFVDRLTKPRVRPTSSCPSELSVLLVEDNRLIRDMFSYAVFKYFRDRAGSVRLDQADDAVSAWEKLGERKYDLVIVDYYLPMQDGASLIARMRADERHAKTSVLAISVGGSDVREATLGAGADVFLHKPLVLRDLFRTLEGLMDHEDVDVA